MDFQQKKLLLENGQQINYIQLNPNQQKILIFIHGNFSSWVWWKDILQIIANKQFKIIAIDQRGFGKSSYKNSVTRFTQHAQDIINFCKLKSLKDVILIGWSYGGGISMKTAQLAPQLVSKVVLTASICHKGLPLRNQKGQQCKTREQILAIPKIQFAKQILQTRNFELQKNIYNLVLFPKMPNYPEEKKQIFIDTSFQQAQYLDVLTALANPDINIEKIKTKILILHGKQDLVIKATTIQQTGKLLNCQIQIWEDAGHMLPVQYPQKYIQALFKFLNQ